MDAKTTIKVIGIGGAGGNAIDRMMHQNIKGIELIAVNTDIQDLTKIPPTNAIAKRTITCDALIKVATLEIQWRSL